MYLGRLRSVLFFVSPLFLSITKLVPELFIVLALKMLKEE